MLKDRNLLHTLRLSCRATPLIVLKALWPGTAPSEDRKAGRSRALVTAKSHLAIFRTPGAVIAEACAKSSAWLAL